MSLLQDPLAAVAQVEWYLNNTPLERFPGAFELAAGNLCRQTVEQALFIVCFFSGMPRENFTRPDRTLRPGGALLRHLDKKDPGSNRLYWTLAARRGQRIRDLVRHRGSLKRWARTLNEPSHFSPRYRKVTAQMLRGFIPEARKWFVQSDHVLVVAIVNDVMSRGRFRAILGPDPTNIPGLQQTIVVKASNLTRTADGKLGLGTPVKNFTVISANDIPRGRWPSNPVVVQNTSGFSFHLRMITRRGTPIDLTSVETIIRSLAVTVGERSYLSRRLKQLGFGIKFRKRT